MLSPAVVLVVSYSWVVLLFCRRCRAWTPPSDERPDPARRASTSRRVRQEKGIPRSGTTVESLARWRAKLLGVTPLERNASRASTDWGSTGQTQRTQGGGARAERFTSWASLRLAGAAKPSPCCPGRWGLALGDVAFLSGYRNQPRAARVRHRQRGRVPAARVLLLEAHTSRPACRARRAAVPHDGQDRDPVPGSRSRHGCT